MNSAIESIRNEEGDSTIISYSNVQFTQQHMSMVEDNYDNIEPLYVNNELYSNE